MAFVLGFAAIFAGAVSANAQKVLTFKMPFDFYVGKNKLSAGNYELQKIGVSNYLLRNSKARKSIIFDLKIPTGKKGAADSESLVFNRYGDAYFLNSIFDVRGDFGRQLFESGYEKQVRRETAKRENKFSVEKENPEKFIVKLSK